MFQKNMYKNSSKRSLLHFPPKEVFSGICSKSTANLFIRKLIQKSLYCFSMGNRCVKLKTREKDVALLATQTCFSVLEVKRLYELFKKLSSSVVDDGFISKEDFQLGMFRNRKKQSIFSDRIYDVFDLNHDGLIDFGEFIRLLSVFHPSTPQEEKAHFAFQIYDIRQTGYIEPEEVRGLILALLGESDLVLPDDIIQAIIDKTLNDVDSKGDGKIDKEEWTAFVTRTPSAINFMTIPFLRDIPTIFPSFRQREDMEEES